MKKAELKTASATALIVDLARTYAESCWNTRCGKSTNRLDTHLLAVCAELVNRGILELGAETFFK